MCAFVAAMAKAAGKKVGMFTSPHLMRYAERIQVDGEPLDDETLASVLNRVLEIGPELTFFEVSTVAALLAFKEAEVDLAVIEVGLGGRLDATNVLPPPRVAVITRISFDHMAELGDSLEAIAAEKVAIHQGRLGCRNRQTTSGRSPGGVRSIGRNGRPTRAPGQPRTGSRCSHRLSPLSHVRLEPGCGQYGRS